MAIGSQGIDMGSEIESLCTSSYRIRALSAPRIRKAETKFNEVKLTEFGEISQVWRDVGGVASSAVGGTVVARIGQECRTRGEHARTYPNPMVNCLKKACPSYRGPHCARCTDQLLMGTMRRRLTFSCSWAFYAYRRHPRDSARP